MLTRLKSPDNLSFSWAGHSPGVLIHSRDFLLTFILPCCRLLSMEKIKTYLVGGAVRDHILGLDPKDLDYSVVASSFSAMKSWLEDEGYTIFLEHEDFGVIRARKGKQVADYVICRKDGVYSDGRRPDFVEVGTLEDDLRRRDFTINSLAMDESGKVIDLFGGVKDLQYRRLRAVGDPMDRLREDPLRAFRALRFSVTKAMEIDKDLAHAMQVLSVIDSMESVSTDRIRVELGKMFAFDSTASMELLIRTYPDYLRVAVDRGIWFEPTVKGR